MSNKRHIETILTLSNAPFSKALGSSGSQLKAFTRQAKAAGLAASAAFAGMAVGIGAATHAFSQFEKSMSNVSTLVNTSTESMQKMGEQVLEISRRTPVAIGDLTAALYDVRSAGIAAGDAMTVLEASAQLGVAGLSTTAEATNIMTSALNAFKAEGLSAGQTSDILFKTVKAGKTTIAELSQAFGATAPLVQAAGVTLADFSAATAALTTVGTPAAQAQNSIRAAVVALQKPTKEMSAIFSEIGVSSGLELIRTSNNIGEAFQKIKTSADQAGINLTKAAGRVEASNAIISLAGSTNEAYLSTLEEMTTGANAVGEAYRKQAATFSSSMKLMQNNIEALGIEIGQSMAPALQDLSNLISIVTQVLSKIPGPAKEVIAQFALVTAGVAGAVAIFGALASVASGPVILAIVGVSAAVVGLYNGFREFFPKIKKFVNDVLHDVISNLRRVALAIDNFFNSISTHGRRVFNSNLAGGLEGVIQKGKEATAALKAQFSSVSNVITSQMKAAKAAVQETMAALPSGGEGGGSGSGKGGKSSADKAKKAEERKKRQVERDLERARKKAQKEADIEKQKEDQILQAREQARIRDGHRRAEYIQAISNREIASLRTMLKNKEITEQEYNQRRAAIEEQMFMERQQALQNEMTVLEEKLLREQEQNGVTAEAIYLQQQLADLRQTALTNELALREQLAQYENPLNPSEEQTQKSLQNMTAITQGYTQQVVNGIINGNLNIQNSFKQLATQGLNYMVKGLFNQITKQNTTLSKNFPKTIGGMLKNTTSLFSSFGKGVANIFKGLFSVAKSIFGGLFSLIVGVVRKIFAAKKKAAVSEATASVLQGALNTAKESANAPFPLNLFMPQLSYGLYKGTFMPTVGLIGSLPSFAVGTGNVTGDMTANIHKGEMIIPKTFAQGVRSGELSISGGKDPEQPSQSVVNINIDTGESNFLGSIDEFIGMVEERLVEKASTVGSRIAIEGAL